MTGSVGTALYRVIHEAMNNVAKHSRATEVRVTLRQEHERLVVTVEAKTTASAFPQSPRTQVRAKVAWV